MKRKSLVGNRFERLLVVSPAPSAKKQRRWNCVCDCGETACLSTNQLNSGNTRSCGCLAQEVRIRQGHANRKHGMSDSPLYVVWHNMMSRCHNRNNRGYHNYGGRGVSVCADWQELSGFMAWALPLFSVGLEIDRTDNDGNYTPENCRFVTSKDNNRNRRNNRNITYKGATRTLSEWSEVTGVNIRTLHSRLGKLNWTVERALTTPAKGIRGGKKCT